MYCLYERLSCVNPANINRPYTKAKLCSCLNNVPSCEAALYYTCVETVLCCFTCTPWVQRRNCNLCSLDVPPVRKAAPHCLYLCTNLPCRRLPAKAIHNTMRDWTMNKSSNRRETKKHLWHHTKLFRTQVSARHGRALQSTYFLKVQPECSVFNNAKAFDFTGGKPHTFTHATCSTKVPHQPQKTHFLFAETGKRAEASTCRNPRYGKRQAAIYRVLWLVACGSGNSGGRIIRRRGRTI